MAGFIDGMRRWRGLGVPVVALLLVILGSRFSPEAGAVAVWVALAGLLGMFLVLLGTAAWSAALAWSLAGFLVAGLGALCGRSVAHAVPRAITVLGTLDLLEPWWLLLLATIPVLIVLSWS